MSIFGTLTIGKQALLAQARAIQVTANNIANVNTPGYTRQRAVFVAVPPVAARGGVPIGRGVELSDVQRIADAALDAQLQHERQELSFHQGIEAGLGRLEGIFQELEGTGITGTMAVFFANLSDLASNPQELSTRNQVVESAITLAELIRNTDRRLYQLQVETNQRVAQLTTEVNEIAADIAQLNRRIFQQEVGGGATASALRDERGQLLTALGETIDFTSFERDDGQISVFVGVPVPIPPRRMPVKTAPADLSTSRCAAISFIL